MPTFGYTTVGTAGSQSVGRRLTGTVFVCPEDCIAESISAYINAWSGSSRSYRWAIYRHSDGALIGLTEERTTTSDVEGWMTLNFPEPKPQLSANTEYVLCGMSSVSQGGSPRIYYDNGGETEGHYQSMATYTFPNPASFTHEARRYSIYCTYTPLAPPSQTKTWSQTGFLSHIQRSPARTLKLGQNLNPSHIFVHHRIMRFAQVSRTLHAWTVIYPALILKQWLVSLNLTHVFRRPTRIIRLPVNLQLSYIGGVPLRLIRFLERLDLAHMVYVAVPGVKKTRLFLVIGDLAIQITGD